ncbi:hypothetical protein [Umezawaea tangerina]|uniref:THAP4-like heme-binding beta-barrel domain-containing protein n=1 Tax=Umezawaea tangerina TaxID=84725 RepID=A0A2T0T2A2_9PSEU|nr:hypothetical protein [Umezawaea tangerina]PRY39800.1 hypothetical protein CLV43_107387 [Umezawaea tangerina]
MADDSAPAPHGRMRELDFFLGEWEAPGVFHETPFGPRKEIDMRTEGADDHRGWWITLRTTELPTPHNPTPLTARYVWGYEPETDEFVADWFDSNGGRARQRSRGWVGDRLEFVGTMTVNGRTVPLRDTFTRRGPDAYHHVGAVDLGSGWLPVDEEDAVRKSGRS